MSVSLLRVLTQNGLIDSARYEEFAKKIKHKDGVEEVDLRSLLFQEKILTPKALAEFLSRTFAYPLFDLSAIE